jgi:DNA-binding CsgD family transcriptional regulator
VQLVGTSPLLGRRAELAAIDAAIGALARNRRDAILLIAGEPGIGKSRLLSEAAARAVTAGCHVSHVRASLAESDVPYALWSVALAPRLEELGPRGVARAGFEDPGALGVVVPSLREPEAATPDPQRVRVALRDALTKLARRGPLLLALDDVQWADPASLDALVALVHRPAHGGILLVLSAREGRLPAALEAALAEAIAEERAITLRPPPLSDSQAAQLGCDAELYALSGGNPFYLDQLARARAARREGASTGRLASVPEAVAAALAAELATLSPSATQLARAASIAGDPFDLDLALAAAVTTSEAGAQPLDELLAVGLLRETGAPRKFAFRHPLLREALELSMPAGSRLVAHERIAEALRSRGAPTLRLARHVVETGRPGDATSIELLLEAASQAQAYTPATAIRFFDAALHLMDGREWQQERLRALLALADSLAATGEPDRARAVLIDAYGREPELMGPALVARLANIELWLGRIDEARRRLQVDLGAQPAQPSSHRLSLALALGLCALLGGHLDDCLARAADARLDAEALPDPAGRAAALALETVARATGALPGAADAHAHAGAAFETLGEAQQSTRLLALWMLARADAALGRLATAERLLDQAQTRARETGRGPIRAIALAELTAVIRLRGRLPEACALGEHAAEHARTLGLQPLTRWSEAELARAQLAAGDVEEAMQSAARAGDGGEPSFLYGPGQPDWVNANLRAATGRAAEGAALLTRSFGEQPGGRLPADERCRGLADLAELQVAVGELASARAAAEAIAEVPSPWAEVERGRALATVLLAEGAAAQAAAAATRAAAAAEELDAGVLAARCRMVEGRAYAATGQREAARSALIAAERALERSGALRERDVTVRELRRLGYRVRRAARPREDAMLTGLSAREDEISALVAAGMSNRGIAEHLVLSVKTIETHLRNIFAKLGLSSRAELARRVGEVAERR